MAESSTITRESARSGSQLEHRALKGDVFEGALLEASEPNVSGWLLMTAQDDEFFTIVRPAHTAASSNSPEIFGVNHVEPLRGHFLVRALF